MKVTAAPYVTPSLLQSAATRGSPPVDFQATLEIARKNVVPANESAAPAKSADATGRRKLESEMTPAEYLAEWVKKTPEQHMREAILKKMGLTEEELNAMPPEQRAEIEHEIADRIKELLLGKNAAAQPQEPAALSIQALLM